MERFGRVGNESDRETRIMNSGIQDDIQIFRHSVSRVGSFAGNASMVEDLDADQTRDGDQRESLIEKQSFEPNDSSRRIG